MLVREYHIVIDTRGSSATRPSIFDRVDRAFAQLSPPPHTLYAARWQSLDMGLCRYGSRCLRIFCWWGALGGGATRQRILIDKRLINASFASSAGVHPHWGASIDKCSLINWVHIQVNKCLCLWYFDPREIAPGFNHNLFFLQHNTNNSD